MADEKLQSTQSEVQIPSDTESVHIGEELTDLEDKGDRVQTAKVVGIVLVAILVVLGIVSYFMRPKPKATGTIDSAYAVALQGDNVLATIRVTFQNIGGKPIWIKNIRARLTAADNREFTDEAASAVDFERYFRGYPDLRDRSLQPLKVETKIQPGDQTRGSIIVSFPVTLDAFKNRKSLAVIVEPYDQAPVTITQ
jgi:hypothetical protein